MPRTTWAEKRLISELSSALSEYWSTVLRPRTDAARRAKRRLKAALEVVHSFLDRGWRRIADERRRARLRARCDDIFERLETALLRNALFRELAELQR